MTRRILALALAFGSAHVLGCKTGDETHAPPAMGDRTSGDEETGESQPSEGPADEVPAATPSRSDRAPSSTSRPSDAIRRVAPSGASPAPGTPPDNPFGYATLVPGCFPGQIYVLPEGTPRLPASYDALEKGPVVHACEWNVSPRDWSEGFGEGWARFEWFAIRYEGAFRVLRSGTYTFRVLSDDGSRLHIDGQPVVDNDGLHGPYGKGGEVELAAGEHTLVLEYFQGPRHALALQVWVTPPDGDEGLLSVRW